MILSFRLGKIPVRIHGSFLVLVVVLGVSGQSGAGGPNLPALAQWLLVVLVGVLLHELGHALVGRSFGLTPQIDLAGLGGLTSWSAGDARALGPGKRIAISLAGPFTGIAIGLAVRAFVRVHAGLAPLSFFGPDTPWGSQLASDVVFVNAGWGVLNLLPILPMDGGNVLFQILNWLTKGHGEKPARIVSAAVAVLIGLAAFLLWRSIYGAFLAGLFAVQNVQALRAGSLRTANAPLREELKAGFGALEREAPAEAVRVANDVLSRATDPAVRSDAVRLLAFGYLYSRAWGDLARLLESPIAVAIGDAELAKFEQAAREVGGPGDAERIRAAVAARPKPAVPKF